MRIILTTAAIALLAACGGNAGNNSAGNAAAPTGATNTAAPAPASTAGGSSELQECMDDVRNELPQGADLNAFCGCTVGKITSNGLGQREAMQQCATEMGIQPRR